MFALGIFLIFIGLLYFLYQKIPNKTIFFSFCLILTGAAAITAYFAYSPPANSGAEDEKIYREKVVAQQHIFINWYSLYQKRIDSLDYNWQQYQSILNDLSNDEILPETAQERLSSLETAAVELCNGIKEMTPPATLNDRNYELTHIIHSKICNYSEAQVKTIRLSKEAIIIDENDLSENQAKNSTTANKPMPSIPLDLVHKLERIRILNAPTGLYDAKEISQIRANLTLPEDMFTLDDINYQNSQEKEN